MRWNWETFPILCAWILEDIRFWISDSESIRKMETIFFAAWQLDFNFPLFCSSSDSTIILEQALWRPGLPPPPAAGYMQAGRYQKGWIRRKVRIWWSMMIRVLEHDKSHICLSYFYRAMFKADADCVSWRVLWSSSFCHSGEAAGYAHSMVWDIVQAVA